MSALGKAVMLPFTAAKAVGQGIGNLVNPKVPVPPVTQLPLPPDRGITPGPGGVPGPRRKQLKPPGRRSTLLAGAEGYGPAPVQRRTLLGE